MKQVKQYALLIGLVGALLVLAACNQVAQKSEVKVPESEIVKAYMTAGGPDGTQSLAAGVTWLGQHADVTLKLTPMCGKAMGAAPGESWKDSPEGKVCNAVLIAGNAITYQEHMKRPSGLKTEKHSFPDDAMEKMMKGPITGKAK